MTTAPKECKQDAGVFTPIIDRDRCEGKADCVPACLYSIFKVDTLPSDLRTGLTFIGRLKGTAHGWQQAYPEQCRACGLCVQACPEHAIKLVRA